MTIDLDDVDFERLIGDRDIDVCKLIEMMNEDGIAMTLYRYAYHVVRGRWPEAEPYIKKDPYWTYFYAKDVIKGRWIKVEPFIKKDPRGAFFYARDVIKGRWPEAEPYIIKDPGWASWYSDYWG